MRMEAAWDTSPRQAYPSAQSDDIRGLCTLVQAEKTFPLLGDYLANMDIKQWMRSKLVVWLQEVGEDLHFQTETVAVSIILLDRFLAATRIVAKSKLQLAGVVAISIAAKMHERCPPTIETLLFLTADSYTCDEIREMELSMLNVLGWRVKVVTPQALLGHFLLFFNQQVMQDVRKYAEFFMEMSFPEYDFLQCYPSVLATCVVLCALDHLGLESGEYIRAMQSILPLDMGTICRVKSRVMDIFHTNFPQYAKKPLRMSDSLDSGEASVSMQDDEHVSRGGAEEDKDDTSSVSGRISPSESTSSTSHPFSQTSNTVTDVDVEDNDGLGSFSDPEELYNRLEQ